MAYVLGELFGKIVIVYFMIYPLIYFAWNFFIAGVNFPQYVIPSFWVGFAGFFILNVSVGIIKRVIRG